MDRLQGKVAVVTGASKGIGAGIARALAAEGAAVVVNYSSDKAGAEKAVSTITAAGGKAIAVQGDVAKAADVERIFAAARQSYGKLDILVNNAGVFVFAPLDAITEEEFHRHYNTNVLGTILCTREAARHFGDRGGSVVNITSIASTGSMPGSAVYSSTKGAVDAITRVLAAELAPRKIRVNAVAPGMVETEGVNALGILDTDMGKAMIAQIPMGRLGQPEDIAKVVVFLASDESGWMTGDRLVASGGQH